MSARQSFFGCRAFDFAMDIQKQTLFTTEEIEFLAWFYYSRFTVKRLAQELHCQVHTLTNSLRRMYQKTGVNCSDDFLDWIQEQGIIPCVLPNKVAEIVENYDSELGLQLESLGLKVE